MFIAAVAAGELSRSAEEESIVQKLLTIALEGSPPKHGLVEEHLQDLLEAGWSIVSVTPIGSSTGDTGAYGPLRTGGWIAIVLIKQ